MDNLYKEYWIENPKEVHEYKIGTYHVSQVGNNHQDLEYKEHSGPCLRQGYWQYLNPIDNKDSTSGNFHMGEIIHEELQRIRKLNNPACIAEFPLRLWIADIIISGSVDLIEFTKEGIHVVDIKSASSYTLPKGDFDKNITHFTQAYIYAFILSEYVFKRPILSVSIIYVDKHNLSTYKQTVKYNKRKAERIFNDFVRRCNYLDKCLNDKEIPKPEPMKWCKYCDRLDDCLECEDVIPIEGRGGKIVGLEVIDDSIND